MFDVSGLLVKSNPDVVLEKSILKSGFCGKVRGVGFESENP